MSLNAFAFANVNANQTDQVVVTGTPNRRILVKGLAAECGATATTITFNTFPGTSGTAVTMNFQNPTNGGFVFPPSESGWFVCNSGDSLSATTGSGSTTGVQVVYTFI